MTTDGSILLKILTGPHQGAEMVLAPGSYIMGHAEDCDIILSDVMVEPKHLRLDCRAGHEKVVRLAGEVYIDGKPLEGQEKEVKPFQYITLGSTYFTLGPATEAWPQHALKPMPALEQSEPKEAASPVPKAQIAKEHKEGEPAAATSSRRTGLAVALTLLAVLFFGAAGWIEWTQSTQTDDTPPPPTLAEVQQGVEGALHNFPFASEVGTTLEDPVVLVEGTVRHDAELRKLRSALDPWRPRISFLVVSKDQLLSDTREILNALDTKLNAELSDEGRIVITGYAGSQAQLEETQRILVRDLPGNLHLTFSVLTNEQAAETASQLVNQYGLGNDITIETSPTGVVASGKIQAEAEVVWDRIRKVISNHLPLLLDFTNDVTVQAQDPADKELDAVDSICVGPIPWFRLHNGQTCFTGAAINGWTVTSITPDVIQVAKNGIVRSIKLGATVSESFDPSSLSPWSNLSPSPYLIK